MSADIDQLTGWTAVAWFAGNSLALGVTAAGFYLRHWMIRRRVVHEKVLLDLNPFSLQKGIVAVAGTVEALDGDGDRPLVTVTIAEGTNKQSVEARPFLLRLAKGVRVRLEPGAKPLLRDALEPGEPKGPRLAKLQPGEQIFVRGYLRSPVATELHGARAVIAKPRWSRMILSTEAFSGELAGQASGLEFQLTMLIGTLVLTQILYVGFWVECLMYWVGGWGPPTIVVGIFFWFALISFSMILGSLLSARDEKPWHSR